MVEQKQKESEEEKTELIDEQLNEQIANNSASDSSNAGKNVAPTDIRTWFTTLSPTERANALSFFDSTILAKIQKLLLLSSSSSSSAPINKDSTLDWDLLLSLDGSNRATKSINTQNLTQPPHDSHSTEIVYSSHAAEIVTSNSTLRSDSTSLNMVSNETPKTASNLTQESPHPDIDNAGRKISASSSLPPNSETLETTIVSGIKGKDGLSNIENDTDEFRIRDQSDTQQNTMSIRTTPAKTNREDSKSQTKQISETTNNDELPSRVVNSKSTNPLITPESATTIISLLENLCVVLPSAVSYALDNSIKQRQPLICFLPSRVNNFSGEQMLHIFDVMLQVATNGKCTKFLIDSNKLSSVAEDGEFEILIAPLFSMLLTKMETSLLMHYNDSNISKVDRSSAISGTEASSPSLSSSDQHEKLEQKMTTQGNATSRTKSEETPKTIHAAGEDKAECSNNTVNTLLHCIQRIETLDSSLSNSQLTEIMSPLQHILSANTHSIFSITYLITLPILHILNSLHEHSDLQALLAKFDNIISNALAECDRISSQHYTKSKSSDDDKSRNPGTVVSTRVDTSHDAERKPTVSATSPKGNNTTNQSTQSSNPSRQQNQSTAAPQKKNNKKKKKKKKRKGPNSEVSSTSKEATAGHSIHASSNAYDSPDDSLVADMSPVSTQKKSQGEGRNKILLDGNKNAEVRMTNVQKTDQSGAEPKSVGVVKQAESGNNGLQSSHAGSVGKTKPVVANSGSKDQMQSEKSKPQESFSIEQSDAKEDNNAWETVEARGRGSRRKSSDRSQSGRFSSQQSFGSSSNTSSTGHHGGGSKKKSARTAASRKRIANRKMVREILWGVLDTVDDEVRRRRAIPVLTTRSSPLLPPTTTTNKWTSGTAARKVMSSNDSLPPIARDIPGSKDTKKVASLRDVVVGRRNTTSASESTGNGTPNSTQRPSSDRNRNHGNSSRYRSDGRGSSNEKPETSSTVKTSGADQNTAPTVPETLSAVSTNSTTTDAMRGAEPRKDTIVRGNGAVPADSCSGESDEALKPHDTSAGTQADKNSSPPPPLPTLLSPGNANSASSSVASSLDAPHGSHHPYSAANENGVGYHLLDICDRLTRDIRIFMKRRSHALTVRRRERSAVLVALQDSLTKLWPGLCHIELYGSCATQLDLPSSDLDVVVCGLDRPTEVLMAAQSNSQSRIASDANLDNLSPDTVNSGDGHAQHHTQRTSFQQHHQHQQYPMPYGHLSMNADRVIRLAVELERQPWAVHVKAIPTASVPVVKILADPARLPGAADNNPDWLMQQHQAGAQGTGSNQFQSQPQPPQQSESSESQQSQMPHYHPQTQGQPIPHWRGADVVNGLLKVDITFEGYEHGGIGSTEFSARVVQEFCMEAGLPPDGTPPVQALMVLKELLAQRRLNEPFSGGLSSYALLLLLISIVRERSVIREELERVERQRKNVAAGGGNAAPTSTLSEAVPAFIPQSARQGSKNINSNKSNSTKVENDKASSDKPSAPSRDSQSVATATAKGKDKQSQTKVPTEDIKHSKKSSNNTHNRQTTSNAEKTVKGAQTTKEKERLVQSSAVAPSTPQAKVSSSSSSSLSSWASIARKNTPTHSNKKPNQETTNKSTTKDVVPEKNNPSKNNDNNNSNGNNNKASSFADAVTKGSQTASTPSVSPPPPTTTTPQSSVAASDTDQPTLKTDNTQESGSRNETKKIGKGTTTVAQSSSTKESKPPPPQEESKKSNNTDPVVAPKSQGIASWNESNIGTSGTVFPQGFHDVIEVLCSGETTAGKLLMHFLLFYGQHFDSHSTAIDYSGKHQRDYSGQKYSHLSPYLQRRSAGTYDPITGMLTVDPIVVYDPLEGAENNNVARSCFAWSNIRWVFAQSYLTLSNAVDRNAANPKASNTTKQSGPVTNSGSGDTSVQTRETAAEVWAGPYSREDGSIMVDPSSTLLELLLSF